MQKLRLLSKPFSKLSGMFNNFSWTITEKLKKITSTNRNELYSKFVEFRTKRNPMSKPGYTIDSTSIYSVWLVLLFTNQI